MTILSVAQDTTQESPFSLPCYILPQTKSLLHPIHNTIQNPTIISPLIVNPLTLHAHVKWCKAVNHLLPWDPPWLPLFPPVKSVFMQMAGRPCELGWRPGPHLLQKGSTSSLRCHSSPVIPQIANPSMLLHLLFLLLKTTFSDGHSDLRPFWLQM